MTIEVPKCEKCGTPISFFLNGVTTCPSCSATAVRLYVWRPRGHGEQTFFVMAYNEGVAIKTLMEHFKAMGYDQPCCSAAEGFGTDYYQMEVYNMGQVAENSND